MLAIMELTQKKEKGPGMLANAAKTMG